MKRYLQCLLAVLVIALVCLNQSLLWPVTGIRFHINSESALIIKWNDRGYDSWGFDYSYGQQYQPDGTWKNLWHRPTWHRAYWRNQSTSS